MPIYKSAFIKFLKSISTWLPLIVTLIIVSVIGAILPFVFLNLESSSVIQTYKIYVIASVTTLGSATSIVSAAFASYKSIQIYKQEIEEGTFLVLVSKPISRKRIILEKWLALLTIIMIYVFIIICFYITLVLLLDPGNKIANLDMAPIKDKIFAIGGVLFLIILILILLFSSIAMIFSSKISSSATVALVAGIGAIIPITGLLPTFTNNQSQTLITRPISVLTTTRIPRGKTIDLIQEIIPDTINKNVIASLFNKINLSHAKIENSNDFVKNLGIYSGEKDVYKDLFYFDLNYQISNISSIASDLLLSKKDSNYISIAAMLGRTPPSPTLGKEVNIIKNNIQINELSKMILNTLQEYDLVVNSKEYGDGVFPFFDYILQAWKIKEVEKTTNENFSFNLNKLIFKLSSSGEDLDNVMIKKFLKSPITDTILNDKEISDFIKNKINNKDNPFMGEIKSIELLLLIKINIELGIGINLIIYNDYVNDFYWKNEVEKISNIDDAISYLSLIKDSESLKIIINKFSMINGKLNNNSVIQLANIFLLTEKSKGGINSFDFKEYANKWVLLAIYMSLTFLLLPTAYLIIKKQDIK